MNIFVLDRNPFKAAQMLCDAHVVKMALESAQLLSTHYRMTICNTDGVGMQQLTDILYKPTHVNHPCRVCLENPFNRSWLVYHFTALLSEYTHRYGKVHGSSKLRHIFSMHVALDKWLPEALDKLTLPKCMPDTYKTEGNGIDSTVQSYRNYYKYKQETMYRFRYTNREIPDWLIKMDLMEALDDTKH